MGERLTDLTAQLCDLTRRWTLHEDVRRSEESECRDIGRRLYQIGGNDAMVDAYRAARSLNPAASVVAAFWHGIGEWQW